MFGSSSDLSRSTLFTPAFNTAIFDGPFRIYFSQHQEAYALNFYFLLQNQLGEYFDQAKAELKSDMSYAYILIYPSEDIFKRCQTEAGQGLSRFDLHEVAAILHGQSDEDLKMMIARLKSRLETRGHSELCLVESAN